MYSRWTPAPCIGKITIKPGLRAMLVSGSLAAGEIFKHTWMAWDHQTGVVEAIFYGEPNGHGWSPPEAHVRSYLIRKEPFNPFKLDVIP